nr:hypothetical protein [Kibdelosporangium sp. MJ126-NF4]
MLMPKVVQSRIFLRFRLKRLSLFACIFVLFTISRDSPKADTLLGGLNFIVAVGDSGIAIAGDNWIEYIPELDASSLSNAGPLSVSLDDGTAAVAGFGRVGIVRPHASAIFAECPSCRGVAAAGRFIVTTDVGLGGRHAIEIKFFDRDMKLDHSSYAPYAPESNAYTKGDDAGQYPITLGATVDKIVVGYLSQSGGSRRGASLIGQYALDGKLLGSVLVNGVIGSSALSHDGRYLALGVGGSGGACITVSDPMIIDLTIMRAVTLAPRFPSDVEAAVTHGNDAWFMLTDVYWRDDIVVVTGEIHAPGPGQSCDPAPRMWRRDVDANSGEIRRSELPASLPTRWLGPGCDDGFTVAAHDMQRVLVRRLSGVQSRLGHYYRITLGHAESAACRIF